MQLRLCLGQVFLAALGRGEEESNLLPEPGRKTTSAPPLTPQLALALPGWLWLSPTGLLPALVVVKAMFCVVLLVVVVVM